MNKITTIGWCKPLNHKSIHRSIRSDRNAVNAYNIANKKVTTEFTGNLIYIDYVQS